MEEPIDTIDLESLDSDPRFNTVKAMLYKGPSPQIHHTRISAKFATEEQSQLEAVVLRHFVDEETPHYKFAFECPPSMLDPVLNGLELLQLRHL